ncbi:glutamyl-tRNA reductase, partial [Dehalococcoidia bacterium]|nr:glutamyl-tRNA reductase [Dehalococcoidia bacterium]
VGFNHRTAPLQIREAVSFSKDQLAVALPELRHTVGKGLILSTCNRTEVYTTTDDTEDVGARAGQFLSAFHGVSYDSIAPHLQQFLNDKAAHHLFRVASGLDSMIVGESQILGQVRDALRTASEAKSVGTPLVELFHAAVRTGRRTREETNIGRNALSISYAGVKLANNVLGDLEDRKVLLIGAGEAGKLVAAALRSAGVREMMITNRTSARSDELAYELSGTAVDFDSIQDALGEVDIAITATEAPAYIVSRPMVEHALARPRPDRPLFIFDLAIPRDVEPSAGNLPNVKLFNIDDLASIAKDNQRKRQSSVADAERIVNEELTRFMIWWESLDAEPMIRTLRMRAETVREQELERAIKRLPDLNHDSQRVLEALTKSIVNRILHDPTVYLKTRATKTELDTARMLYGLCGEEDAAGDGH